jgi:hypothetical protein
LELLAARALCRAKRLQAEVRLQEPHCDHFLALQIFELKIANDFGRRTGGERRARDGGI